MPAPSTVGSTWCSFPSSSRSKIAQHGQDSHHRGSEGLSQTGPSGGKLLVPEQVETLAQAILHQATFKRTLQQVLHRQG